MGKQRRSRQAAAGSAPPPAGPGPPPAGRPARPPHPSRLLGPAAAAAALIILLVAVYAWHSRQPTPGGASADGVDRSARNVLLITLDTTRADHLGCYGHGGIRTPGLDALARDGVLFETAYAPAVITLPSHASILTGLLPPAHGVRANSGQRLSPGTATLAGSLKEAGYRTGAVIGAFVLDARFGLDEGFDSYDDDLPEAGRQNRKFPERSATEVTDAALGWLSGGGGEKWFLWVHYYDPHMAYKPPSPYREEYAGSLYDGEIAYMDTEIGRLLAGIARMGAARRTIVIAAGDHGEGLQELDQELKDHGEQGHGIFLYDETARVPLIVSAPGMLEAPRRISSVVRLIDIVPTIRDMLKLPALDSLPGASLWPMMQGHTGETPRPAYSEATSPFVMYGWSPLASLREGDWKYIQAPRPELYDMAADPAERINLLAADRERAAAMKRRLEGIHDGALESGAGAERLPATSEEMEKLRSLGYVGGGGPTEAAGLSSDPSLLLEGGSRGLADPKDRLEQLARITELNTVFRAGNHSRAVVLARAILAAEPDNPNLPQVIQLLGDALRGMGQHGAALDEYRRLLERDPGNVELLLRAGLVLMDLKRPSEAKIEIDKALSIEPENVQVLSTLCGIHGSAGADDSALECHRKILELHPGYRPSLMTAARIYEMKKMPSEAEGYYERAAELDPEDILSRLSLASVRMMLKDHDGALATLDEAAAADPTLPDLDLFRADILFEMRRLPDAARLYRQALDKAPREPLGHLGLGRIAAAKGDTRSARSFFRQALAIDPASAAAREELMKLDAGGQAGK